MKIICWINDYDRKEFSQYNDLDIKFSKNFSDFDDLLNKSNDQVIPVISMTKISVGINKIKVFLQKHSCLQFYLLDKKFGSYKVNELLFLTLNDNVINKKYFLNELLKDLNIIQKLI